MSNKQLIEKTFTVHHAELRNQNKVAVYVTIYLEDENGNLWYYETAQLKFELKKSAVDFAPKYQT